MSNFSVRVVVAYLSSFTRLYNMGIIILTLVQARSQICSACIGFIYVCLKKKNGGVGFISELCVLENSVLFGIGKQSSCAKVFCRKVTFLICHTLLSHFLDFATRNLGRESQLGQIRATQPIQ